ncbi:DUF4906 domain-containing protein [Phocaeicola sp.]
MKIRAYFITLSFLLATLMACQDETLDIPAPATSDGTVPVELSIGFADEEDGYGTGNDSRTVTGVGDDAATGLDAQLVPETKSRAGDEMKPNGLYQLHIMQMQQNGTAVKTFYTETTQVTGGHIDITASLNVMDHCKLVIAVRGEGITTPAFPGALSGIQNLVSTTSFSGIPTEGASQEQINKMPYVLYLEDVNIVKVNDKFVIQSPDGKDVRIRLKRLAAKLTVKWNFNVTDYELEEVRLCQMPKAFYFLPEREKNDIWTDQSYPTLVKEYIDYFRLTGDELTGGTVDDLTASGTVSTEGGYSVYTTWLPANVKGTAPEATAPSYRNKDIAPTGAGYLEFVAVKKDATSNEVQERLFYRVYLGGKETTDFNVRENTNYVWTVNITGANYNKDPRIDRQETTPVPQKDDNFKNTANCFMIQPNSSFSFNPYKHEAGTNGWNDQLIDTSTGTIKDNQEITDIKLLWQSKDSGTTGALVMGYQLKDNDYANQMVLTNAGDPEKARIYVRVPYSKGGNAVIAAYHKTPGDSEETIVWSWHLWITDYVPARINTDIGYSDYKAAQKRSLNGTVHKYRSEWFNDGKVYGNMVMMDRDIGAQKGGYAGLNGASYTAMDGVKRQGLLYQWGRKDPFFTSADGTTNEINTIYSGNGIPMKVDKVAYSATPAGKGATNNMEYSIQNPLAFINIGNNGEQDWYKQGISSVEAGGGLRWNKSTSNMAPGTKSLYDPSPEGWKIPMMRGQTYTSNNDYATSIFKDINNNSYRKIISENADKAKNGILFLIESTDQSAATIDNSAWFNLSPERVRASGNFNVSTLGHIWFGDMAIGGSNIIGGVLQYGENTGSFQLVRASCANGWSVRCIQDNKD